MPTEVFYIICWGGGGGGGGVDIVNASAIMAFQDPRITGFYNRFL